MVVAAGLLVVGGGVSWFGLRDASRPAGGGRRSSRRGRLRTPLVMPRDWDARTYDRVADPMTRWGTAVARPAAARRRRTGAGCRLRHAAASPSVLVERLPRGRVIALDGSPSMVAAARDSGWRRSVDRVEYVVADLGRPLPIDGLVDAVLSTATFHWVPDHDALFATSRR